MKCPGIYVYSFFAFGDSDDEIRDNTGSLQKKFQGKNTEDLQALTMVSIQNAVGGDINRKDTEVRAPEMGSTVDNFGVYLLAHGGQTNTKPGASMLAKTVYDDLISKDIPVRKINLASCYGAGDQLKVDSVKAAPLAQFCKELKDLAEKGGKTLPAGLMVCAYQSRVTTFDADAGFIKAAIARNEKLDAGLTESGKLGQIRTTFTGNSAMKETHPKQGLGTPGDIRTMKNDLMESAIQKAWDQQQNKGKKKKDQVTGNLIPDEKIEEFMTNSGPAIMTQVRNQISNKDPSTRDLWLGMENYIKKKLVMRVNDKGTFEMASIAEYTDNPELSKAVQIVESSMDKSSLPTVKIGLDI